MDARVRNLEARVALLEKQFPELQRAANQIQCTSVEVGDAVLVSAGPAARAETPVEEFVRLFVESPLHALAHGGVAYLLLWPHFDAPNPKIDYCVPTLLKLHTGAIVSRLHERGYSAAFHKLSKYSELSTLHCCYYRCNPSDPTSKMLFSYPRRIGSTGTSGSKGQVLAVWERCGDE